MIKSLAICLFFPVLLLCSSGLSAQNFRVQIAAFNEQMPSAYFKERGVERYVETTDQQGLYRYFAGAYATRDEAEAVCKSLVAKGFPYAHVIDLEVQRVLCGAGCPYFRHGMVFNQDPSQGEIVNTIFFDFGSFALSPESKDILDRFFVQLRDKPELKLKIHGFADGVGSAQDNLELSTERARAARNHLVYKGIRADRIQMEVFGEANPLLANKDEGDDLTDAPKNRKWNRRVVLMLVETFEETPSDNPGMRN
jgi:outer membrane protein OmpA-like peptidoglycan-associated protein